MLVLLFALGCSQPPAEPTPAAAEPVAEPASEPAAEPAPEGPSEAEVLKEVEDFVEQYRTTLEVRKLGPVQDLYSTSPDFSWMEGGRRAFRNPRQIVEAISRIPPHAKVLTTYEDVKITLMGPDHAMARILYSQVAKFPGRTDIESSGAMTLVVQREGEGWAVLHGHNSAAPPPPPKDTP